MGVCNECHTENPDESVQCMVCGALLHSDAVDDNGMDFSDPSLELEYGKLGARPRRKRKKDIGFVGAPVLPPSPTLPKLVRALPRPQGLTDLVQYAVGSRKLIPQQRDALRQLSGELARLKKQQSHCTMALGRAVRKHERLPRELRDTATEADRQDAAVAAGTAEAERKHQQQVVAEQARAVGHRAADARMALLREQHAPILQRAQELQQQHAELKEKYEQAQAEETRLRDDNQREITDDDVGGEMRVEDGRIVVSRRSKEEEQAARRQAYAAVLTERTRLHDELQTIATQFAAQQQPLRQIQEEMARVEAYIRAHDDQVHNAEEDAKVAAQAAQRKTALANRSSAEIDEEIGAFLLKKEIVDPAFELLHGAVKRNRERICDVEDTMSLQQDEFDLFDAAAATRGTRLVVGGVLFIVLVLTAAGGAVIGFL
jgi:hypothetical protein